LTGTRGTFVRLLAGAWIAAVPLTAVAQQGAVPPQAPPTLPAVTARPPESVEVRRDSAVRLARAQLGRRYLFGGTTPRGFDCSGFLKYLMRALGVEVPRTAAEQARVGQEVPRDPALLRPGDILTFGRGNRVTHVGIYVGDGKYIHASSGAGRIIESRLDRRESRLVRAWYGVRRLFTDRDSASSVAAAAAPKDRS
jgi:cell wall-associated NlpC family hydrolase